MTDKDKDRIECAIRHIKSSVDVDLWAMEIAIDAMLKQLSDQDCISRQAIDVEGINAQIRCEMCRNPMHTDRGCDGNCEYDEKLYERIMQILSERIKPLPSVQPDITGAIWDALSRVYNMPDVPDKAKSIIGDVMLCLQSDAPEPERNAVSEQPVSDRLGVKTCKTCTDTISRQDAYDTLTDYYHHTTQTQHDALRDALGRVPSVEPEQRWIPCSDVPDTNRNVFIARGEQAIMTVCIGHYNHDYKQWYEDRDGSAKGVYDGLYWCEMPPLPEPWKGETE